MGIVLVQQPTNRNGEMSAMKRFNSGKKVTEKRSMVLIITWVTLLSLTGGCKDEPLQNYGSVTSFELTHHTGTNFQSDSMKEKVWLVSFFFSRCKTICPPLIAFIKDVADTAAKQEIPLSLVSITVDPDHDTPEKLSAKHKELDAGPNWNFLTGSSDDIRKVVVDGFKTHMGEEEIMENGLIEIGHGAKIMLIDGQGIIRGLFSADEMGKESLLKLANKLTSS